MTNSLFPAIPLIQAPMAGGITTPALVSAVANAGAVGSFGFAYSTAEKIAADMAEARALTDGLINANFFVFDAVMPPAQDVVARAIAALCDLPVSLNETSYDVIRAPFVPDLQEQLSGLTERAPDYLTFHFGVPPEPIITQAQAAGIKVGVTATSVDEANAIADAGADFIVAQGYEAGGHRGTFTALAEDDEKHPTLALTTLLAKWGRLPLVTAGGIMTGADIAQARKAGAQAVQMGTAFLCADEAGTASSYREALLSWHETQSVMTAHFSGRYARAIENDYIRHMTDKRFLAFPLQNTLTGPLCQKAAKEGDAHFQSLWAGTGFHKIQQGPAAQIIQTLLDDMAQA